MSDAVYKYPVPLLDEFEVLMPTEAEVLCFQVQREEPFVWVKHTANATVLAPRKFRLAGTGHRIEGPWLYIGTVQIHGGELVFHLFERGQ